MSFPLPETRPVHYEKQIIKDCRAPFRVGKPLKLERSISGLLKAGLIKRHKGTYSLTLLGRVVYDSQMIIGEALSHYWKLKAIETIEMSGSNLSAEAVTQLINALIDNHRIKDILMKPVPVSSINSKSKIQESTPVITQTQL